MTERVIIAGAGGQGVMLLGKILAEAAMREAKFVTWLPSYGAEVRGGTSHSTVVISDTQIGSPYVKRPDSLIIMNAPSLERFKNRLPHKGLLIINSSLVTRYTNKPSTLAKVRDKNVHVLQYPFTDIAIKLGNIRVANMVALGCFIAQKKVVGLKSISRVISDIAPEEKKHLIEINKKALEEGANLK